MQISRLRMSVIVVSRVVDAADRTLICSRFKLVNYNWHTDKTEGTDKHGFFNLLCRTKHRF